MAISRRQTIGPLLLGLLVGGIPFGILLYHFGVTGSWGDQFFPWLTPVAVVISGLSASLGVGNGPTGLFWRAWVAAFSACVPVPALVWTLLAWHAGFQILDFRNLTYALILFALWAVVVAVLGWLLATGLTFLKRGYSPTQRTDAM